MWIRFDEAINILGCSRGTLYNRLERGIYKSTCGARQANGKSETLIELESLPAAAQVRYYRRESSTGNAAVAEPFRMDGTIELSPTEMETAWHRAQVVMEMAQPAAGVKRCDHLAALAGREGISLSKLYKWEKVFKAQGLAGLVKRRGRSDCGIKRVFDQEAVKYLKAQYTGRRSKLKAYEDLAGVAVDMGWKIGSYAQACRILTSEIDRNEALRTYMVGGALALKNSAAPCILRDYSDLQPLEYVCGDHAQADVLVWDEAEKRIMRPWVTAWEDLRTRCVWGWHVNRQPNSRTIALALRHGILPKSDQNPIYGIPQNVYIDNGKDYRSNYLGGETWKLRRIGIIDLDAETRGVFAELGIEPKYALPFNPGSKPIERLFNTLHNDFESQLPAYLTGKIDTRDGAKIQSDIDSKKLITFEQYKSELKKWIEARYHARAHRGIGMDGCSPLAAWQECTSGGFEPVTMRAGTLDMLLMMREEHVMVSRHGVTLNRVLFHNPVLIHYLKQYVDIRYDPDNLSEVYIFQNGKYLLTARAYDYASMRDSAETIAQRMKENRGAGKEVRRQFMAITNGQDRPNNLKNKSSVKIRRTVYDVEAEKIGEDALPVVAPIKNWQILPPEEN